MIQLWQAMVLALSVGTSTSTRQFLPLFEREPRSLRDTFPFSVQAEDNEVRQDRQVSRGPRSFIAIEFVNLLRAQSRNNLFPSLKWLLPTLRGKGEEIRFKRHLTMDSHSDRLFMYFKIVWLLLSQS